MEYFETDLARLLHNSIQIDLTEDHVITIFYNILCALNVVHSSNVIHRDIKPANILIDENCHVRICDFGLSRTILEQPNLPCKDNIAHLANKKGRLERIKSNLLLRKESKKQIECLNT